jgi:hypothetical protein|tara:strand:+ start:1468 stop:1815 length:348 start_codon:yes stop_codon:yes gene_type:complete
MAEKNSVLDRAKDHFSEMEMKVIEVEEWGEGNEALVIYAKPLTLRDKSRILKMSKGDDISIMAEVVVMKAEDKDGNCLFTRADKETLMRSVDPDIIARIAAEIMGSESFEDHTKN